MYGACPEILFNRLGTGREGATPPSIIGVDPGRPFVGFKDFFATTDEDIEELQAEIEELEQRIEDLTGFESGTSFHAYSGRES
jgi:hypothetical protein